MEDEPTCFGIFFDETASECCRCAASVLCSRACGNRTGETIPDEPEEPSQPEVSDVDGDDDVTPFEHLIKSLDGRFDREDKDGDSATGIFFSEGGNAMVQVITSKKTGRIKVKTRSFERLLDSTESVESVEDAEDMLSRMMA